MLVIGIAVFVGTHLSATVCRDVRQTVIDRFGQLAYRIAFALLSGMGILLMVVGWQITDTVPIYAPPDWGRIATFILMTLAFLLFGASHGKSYIRIWVRHPQLVAGILFSVAHLLSNGDSNGLVLFGSIGLWSLCTMFLINRREGPWRRESDATLAATVRNGAISLVITAVVYLIH